MTHEKLLFEMASGWDFKNTSSKRENVIMRDYFVQLMIGRYPLYKVGFELGRAHPFSVTSQKRFNTYYQVERDYRERFEEIKKRYDEIEMAEDMI